MVLPWGRYLNLAQAWVFDGATTESKETFMAGLWQQRDEAERAAKLEEIREEAKAEGRELTTRERLLLARPDWNPERKAQEAQFAAAQLQSMKTKAQHRARVDLEREGGEP